MTKNLPKRSAHNPQRRAVVKAGALAAGLFASGLSTQLSAQTSTVSPKNQAPITLLNVSYDPTRELYQDINKAFAEQWKTKTGQEVTIRQSHGGSGKQARAVIDGLAADVVTLALAYDIDQISENAQLLPSNWQTRLPHNSAPYNSTIVFLVRKGNPKGIRSWDDLVKPDVSIITPNPKTSGGARWNYLAAWGWGLKKFNGDEAKTQEFLKQIYQRVPVLDSGARGSTTTFVERGIGDVLLAWENEAYLSIREFGPDKVEVVTPSISILAEPPVAIVDKIVDKRDTRSVAQAYLEFLYTPTGQQLIAKNGYRAIDPTVSKQFASQFPNIELLTVDKIAGGWKQAHQKHFSEGGIFDIISRR